MSKHVTEKGVSNSLRGFFERVLKPYISSLFKNAATDASERYKMDYIGTFGSLAVFKKSLPTWYQYSGRYDSRSTEDKFIIERNRQVVFDSSTDHSGQSPFTKVAPENAKNFSTLNALLSDYAFPLNSDSSNNIFINPGAGSTQNVFYVSKSSNTETYDGEVLPIGSIKINNVTNLRPFGNYYFSTIEDRPENCGLYSLTLTTDTKTFTLKERILNNTKLREKLVEVLETTDEELETRITSIRILDAMQCVHTSGYDREYYKAYCILLEVNKNKLVSIYSYKETNTATFNESTKQVDVFDIPSYVKLAQLRSDAYSGYNFKESSSDRYQDVLFKTYLETPIVTSDKHIYRFVFDPGYTTVTETISNKTIKRRSVADKATVTFQEVDLGDFTFKGAIDIINDETQSCVKSYGDFELIRGNSYVATTEGLILFNTLANPKQVTSVTVLKPEINCIANSSISCIDNTKIIKMRGGRNQDMYAGFFAIESSYSDLRWTYIYYSPDGIHWFSIGNSYNRLVYTLTSLYSGLELYGSNLISNYDLRLGSVILSDLMRPDSNKIMEFIVYNKKDINKLNLNNMGYDNHGYSEIEAFYLIESDRLGKLMPEIKRK